MRRLVHHHPSRSFCKSSVKQCLLSKPSWFEGLPSTLHIKAIPCFGDALWNLFFTYLDFGSLAHLGSILPECSGKSRVPKAFCRSFSFAITAWSHLVARVSPSTDNAMDVDMLILCANNICNIFNPIYPLQLWRHDSEFFTLISDTNPVLLVKHIPSCPTRFLSIVLADQMLMFGRSHFFVIHF